MHFHCACLSCGERIFYCKCFDRSYICCHITSDKELQNTYVIVKMITLNKILLEIEPLSDFELNSINGSINMKAWCKSCLQQWPLPSLTLLTQFAGGWLDMIMSCWHQKKCWQAQRGTASSKHVIYGSENGLASAGAALPFISHTNLDARVWLWLPAIGWCITWIAVSMQQGKISSTARLTLDPF